LMYGIPTLGIVGNNDQLLNMAHVEKLGAGAVLRYWDLTEEKIIAIATDLLENPAYRLNAQKIQSEFVGIDVKSKLRQIISDNV
jgi:UDP:flavonoid glycosyltransferase YjiC (YdhE family)